MVLGMCHVKIFSRSLKNIYLQSNIKITLLVFCLVEMMAEVKKKKKKKLKDDLWCNAY